MTASTEPFSLDRKRFLDIFELQAAAGPYDEAPIVLAHIDPQLHLSRNDRPQPFFLICAKDTMLVALSGEARVEFKDSAVNWHPMLPGDFVYVPAGTPHRIVPSEPSLHLRYKALHPGREGVAWYCERCGTQLHRIEWNETTIAQDGYARSCRWYAENLAGRACPVCALAAPELTLEGIRWDAIAAALRTEAASET
jgi:hypothetical protein